MGIRIGYEPVGAIGAMAYETGKGKNAQRLEEMARQDAQQQANREFQMRLETFRRDAEKDEWRAKAEFQLGAQKELSGINFQEQQALYDQQARLVNERQQEAELRAQERQEREFEMSHELKPVYQQRVQKLEHDLANTELSTDLTADEKIPKMAESKAQIDAIRQNKGNFRKKQNYMTAEELTEHVKNHTIEIPDETTGEMGKYYFDEATGKLSPIYNRSAADKLKYEATQQKQQETIRKAETARIFTMTKDLHKQKTDMIKEVHKAEGEAREQKVLVNMLNNNLQAEKDPLYKADIEKEIQTAISKHAAAEQRRQNAIAVINQADQAIQQLGQQMEALNNPTPSQPQQGGESGGAAPVQEIKDPEQLINLYMQQTGKSEEEVTEALRKAGLIQ